MTGTRALAATPVTQTPARGEGRGRGRHRSGEERWVVVVGPPWPRAARLPILPPEPAKARGATRAPRHAGRPALSSLGRGVGVTDRVFFNRPAPPPSCERCCAACAPLSSELTAPWARSVGCPASRPSSPCQVVVSSRWRQPFCCPPRAAS
jgi:hypothetical protein